MHQIQINFYVSSSSSQTAAVKVSVGETTASKQKAKSTTEVPAKEAEPKPAEASNGSKEAASDATTRSRAEGPKVTTHRVMLPIVSLKNTNEPLITCVIQ